MAVGAVIKDGVIQETASQSSVQKANSSSNGMDKDAFLQLLVAQMKYQDPLEPTSNTEYISQYATFSQVEQMQNMAATMELTRASSMVGKLVNVSTTNSVGETTEVEGIVEFVTYENNKAYVSIDGTLYSADDVTAVIDETYYTAYNLAISFITAMNKLPSLAEVTLDDKETITALQESFNKMSSYQQSFISNDYVKMLQTYVETIAKLEEQQKENSGEGKEDAGNTEGTGSTESTGNTDNAGNAAGTDSTEGAEKPGSTEGAGSVAGTDNTEETESSDTTGEGEEYEGSE